MSEELTEEQKDFDRLRELLNKMRHSTKSPKRRLTKKEKLEYAELSKKYGTSEIIDEH